MTSTPEVQLIPGPGASLVESRRRLLDIVCWLGAIVGAPVCAEEIWVNVSVSRWDLIAFNAIVGIALVVLALARRLPYGVRAGLFCALMALTAGAAWILAGFVLDSAALHLTAVLLPALLLDRRAALLTLLGESVVFAFAAFGHLYHWLPSDPQIEAAGHSVQNWITGGAVLTATAILLGMGLTVVLRNVEDARLVAVHLAHRLAIESEARLVEIGRREETQRLLLAAQRRDALALLAGGLAHDFNNLLTVVNYAFEQAEHEVPMGGQAADALALGRAAAASTATLTRQLLSYSRGDPQGKVPTDLGPLLRTTMAMLGRMIPKDIQLLIDVPDTLPPVVCAPTQIQQVLLNLAVNARDAMPGGGQLVIKARVDDAAVELSVSDNGSGIAPEISERIFEPLFSTKAPGEGTGLGLAVVATVVADHGGTIAVHSRPGEGATFEVRLPRVKVEARRALPPPALPSKHRPRLLVVDDEAPIRSVLARVLRTAGNQVQEAASADEAARIVAAGVVPDLIVTDLSMPGTPGSVFAGQMLAAHPQLRVLIASGYGTAEELAEVLATGRAAVLVKPFSGQAVCDAVDALLGSGAAIE